MSTPYHTVHTDRTARPIPPMKRARVLITNDDGYDAHGIKVLHDAISSTGADVWVVAPDGEYSATSHSVTTQTPLRLINRKPQHYALTGRPADCVIMAVNHIMTQALPDIILSGVNHGRNVGDDITYSGTVGAAMEGTLVGIPSIAFSQHCSNMQDIPWHVATHWLVPILEKLEGFVLPFGNLLNINFPDSKNPQSITGISTAPQAAQKVADEVFKTKDPRGRDYYWLAGQINTDPVAGSDADLLERGHITATPIALDMTNHDLMSTLNKALQ